MSAPISRTTSQENITALPDATVATGFAADANPTTAPAGKTTHTNDMRYRTTGSVPITEADPHKKGPALPKSTQAQQDEFTTKLAQAAQRTQNTDAAKASDDKYDIDPITLQKTPPKVPDSKPKLADILKPKDDDSENEAGHISDAESDTSNKSDNTDDKRTVFHMNSKAKIINLIEHGYSLVKQCNAKIKFIDGVLSKRISSLTSGRSKTMPAVNTAIQAKRQALTELSSSLLLQISAMQKNAMVDEAQNVRLITTLTNLIDHVEKQIQSFPATTLQDLHAKDTSAEPRYGQLATAITSDLCKIEKPNVTRIIMTEAQGNQAFLASTAAAHRGDQDSQQINYATVQVSDAMLTRIMPQGKK